MSKRDRADLLAEYEKASDDTLFSEEYPAARLGIKIPTLQRKRWLGGSESIPYLKIGAKLVRYRKADIEAYIAKYRTFQSTSQAQIV